VNFFAGEGLKDAGREDAIPAERFIYSILLGPRRFYIVMNIALPRREPVARVWRDGELPMASPNCDLVVEGKVVTGPRP
jgi:hypothetical protein